jgi:2-hydroxychromene-2-carboxylate isomerase
VPADGQFAAAAVRAGLDPEALAACTRSPPEAARRVIEAARAAGIEWSPTLVVGRRAYAGGVTDDRLLADLLDLELAPGLLGTSPPIPAPTHRDR